MRGARVSGRRLALDTRAFESGVRDGADGAQPNEDRRDAGSYLSGYIEGRAYRDGRAVSHEVAMIARQKGAAL